jgi:hypothetical protein
MAPPDAPSSETGRSFQRRTTEVVRAHWQDLQSRQALPHRDAIDPRKINDVLDQVVLIERTGSGKAIFRVSGMAINGLSAKELRGAPFEDIFAPDAHAQLATSLCTLFERPSILAMHLSTNHDPVQPPIIARLHLFPLQGHNRQCELAIGGIDLKGARGCGPRRFRIERTLSEPILFVRSRRPNAPIARPRLALMTFDTGQ